MQWRITKTLCKVDSYTAKRLPKSMHFIQKSIKDWIVKSLQKSILLRDFSDFIEVFDFSDGFTIQSQSDYKMIWDQISLCKYLGRDSISEIEPLLRENYPSCHSCHSHHTKNEYKGSADWAKSGSNGHEYTTKFFLSTIVLFHENAVRSMQAATWIPKGVGCARNPWPKLHHMCSN